MGIDVVRRTDAVPERHGSSWSTVAVVAAALAWVGGVLLHILGVLAPMVAVVGLVVAAAGRERRSGWRVAAVAATLASAGALSLYALVLTGTVSWPPTG